MLLKADKNKLRQKRHMRVRNHIHGTAQRPRLIGSLGSRFICVAIIDDEKGVALTAASNEEKDFEGNGDNIEDTKKVGAAIAKKALDKGITEVVFDIGGYINHESLKVFEEAAREGGLKF